MTALLSLPQLLTDRQITGALLLALLLAAVFLLRCLRPRTAPLQPRPILTANEREFFHRLTRSLPACHIFPQVSLSALMEVSGQVSRKRRFDVRRRFALKYADFVICAPGTLAVIAIVELDDRTHDAARDRQRDAMLRAAGYQTIRYPSRQKPSEAQIAALFARLFPLACP